ncbi:metallophosphoesterase family protein [Turicibacter sanguinis]|jgi:phosphodiesterase family protein|uniref:metallophosphoesterase family protein n=1 Tax=Turicibacter TaxID=191303 RepID=UPI0011C9DB72|nr:MULTISPECIES: metallophosphoesterase family protein [Turicibacter]MBP3904835.1 metallophosphoesterase family protein [Turicibacter sp.]MCU7197821.1 metallophosphatase family protein [Turicibacter sanguinis]MCU7202221.1 metallophosphatase family protein [Turicibacter sanguinis]MDB8438047.1 metallophosphoesterase family protein [Turicibacter sanguinis]MDB8540721.1 metallophosphoesterase family protein [Turicibacter sanguinis]
MRIGVIADIHGNLHALKAIIRDLNKAGISDYIIAGDLIADCSQPNEVLDYIKTLNATVIKGNREDYVLSYLKGENQHWRNYEQMASVVWTAKTLTKENVEYIKGLSDSCVRSCGKCGCIRIVHGSPFHISEHLYEDKEQDRLLEAVQACQTEVLVCGHSHRPWKKEVNQTLVLNPGAAGVHFNQWSGAEYAILSFEDGKWQASHHIALYSVEDFKQTMYKSSLYEVAPIWARLIVQSIEEGFNANINFLRSFEATDFHDGLIENEVWNQRAKVWFNFEINHHHGNN